MCHLTDLNDWILATMLRIKHIRDPWNSIRRVIGIFSQFCLSMCLFLQANNVYTYYICCNKFYMS